MHTASGGANACSHATTGDMISREPSFLSQDSPAAQIRAQSRVSAMSDTNSAVRQNSWRCRFQLSSTKARSNPHGKPVACHYFERKHECQDTQVPSAMFISAHTKSQEADWRSFILSAEGERKRARCNPPCLQEHAQSRKRQTGALLFCGGISNKVVPTFGDLHR